MNEIIQKKDKFKGSINLDLTINSGQTSQAPWLKSDDGYKIKRINYDEYKKLTKTLYHK